MLATAFLGFDLQFERDTQVASMSHTAPSIVTMVSCRKSCDRPTSGTKILQTSRANANEENSWINPGSLSPLLGDAPRQTRTAAGERKTWGQPSRTVTPQHAKIATITSKEQRLR